MKKFLLTFLCFLGMIGCSWAQTWEKTAITNLVDGDIIVIVDETGSTAMSNNNGTSKAPDAVSVTLSADKTQITSVVTDNIKFIFGGSANNYTFAKDETSFLYCTSTNNGVRVGTNANKTFTWTGSYLKNNATSRFIGVYNNQDWRCYTSSNTNISNTVTSFYKKVEGGVVKDPAGLAFGVNEITCVADVTYEVAFTQVTDAEVTFTSSNPAVATYEEGYVLAHAPGTATITATCDATDTYAAGSSTLKVTVTAPPAANIAAFKANGKGVTGDLILNDAVVIGVATNGNTYIQDATGGICLYKNVPSDLKIGDVLNGTVFGTMDYFNGLPELASGNYDNVTVTEGEAPAPKEMLIDEITEADYCTLVVLKNAHCTELAANAQITQTGSTGEITLYTTFTSTFPEYQNFNITGVVSIYNGKVQILPRSEADIVEIEGEKVTEIEIEKTEVSLFVDETYTLGATVNSGAVLTYASSDENVATVNENGIVTAVAAGVATITISAPANDGYPEAEATVTITVKEMPQLHWVMLVADGGDGKYYAVSSETGSAKNTLKAVEVAYVNGVVYVDILDNNLLWNIDEATGYVMSFSGEYLSGTSGKTDISLSTTPVEWKIGTDGIGIGSRALIYSTNGYFKNYAASNLGNKDYGYGALPTEYYYVNKVKDGAIVLVDGYAYTNEEAVENVAITYSRTVANAENYVAWYAPFEINVSEFESAAQFNSATTYEGEEAIEFTIKEAGVLEANTPYIVKVKADVTTYTANGTLAAAESKTVESGGYSLTGVYEPTNVAGKYVITTKGTFNPGSANAILKPFRFYLTVPASQQGKPMRVIIDGQTSSVEGLTIEDAATGACYDLQGRKIEKPANGIFIINGKKVVK